MVAQAGSVTMVAIIAARERLKLQVIQPLRADGQAISLSLPTILNVRNWAIADWPLAAGKTQMRALQTSEAVPETSRLFTKATVVAHKPALKAAATIAPA